MSLKWVKIILTVSLILLLFLVPVTFYSFNNRFYYSEMEKNGVYSHLPREKAVNYTDSIINFLGSDSNLSFLTSNEESHMNDVKKMFNMLNILLFISAISFGLSIGFLFSINFKNKKFRAKSFCKDIHKSLFYASIISLSIIFLLFIFSLSFSSSFDAFHKVFFPQGNWQFPYDSTLITLLPEAFFIHISQKIMIMSSVASVILLLISFVFYYFAKDSNYMI